MILTAHQPVYLPWLGLFHKIALSDAFVWFDDVQYQKRDWNNRNKIKTNSGPAWLTVPVHNKDHYNIVIGAGSSGPDTRWGEENFVSIITIKKGSVMFSKKLLNSATFFVIKTNLL